MSDVYPPCFPTAYFIRHLTLFLVRESDKSWSQRLSLKVLLTGFFSSSCSYIDHGLNQEAPAELRRAIDLLEGNAIPVSVSMTRMERSQ
jgi:hypothetical protein